LLSIHPDGQGTRPDRPPTESTIRLKDIYDDMPDGAAQRRANQRRLAELEREGASRRARIAQVVSSAKLSRRVVLPACQHTL